MINTDRDPQHPSFETRPAQTTEPDPGPLDEEREDADGTPYMGYFRNDLTLGFVWSGHQDRPVQVTREMGEPIIAEFPLTVAAAEPADVVERFRNACDLWAERWAAAGDDASLGVGHIWTNVKCPAYRTFNPAECTCKED